MSAPVAPAYFAHVQQDGRLELTSFVASFLNLWKVSCQKIGIMSEEKEDTHLH
jgi:hypothetical protein